MLVAIIAAMFFANNIIEANSQLMEFNNAKNVYKYLGDALEQVALGSGGARYVRVSMRSGGPEFRTGAYRLLVEADGAPVIDDDNGTILMFRGGSLVSTFYEVIRPETFREVASRAIVGLDDPVTVVYTIQKNRAYIVLNTSRVRVGYLGLYGVRSGSGISKYDVYEVVYVRLYVGMVSGGAGQVSIVLRNTGTNETEYRYDTASVNLRVRVDAGIDNVFDFDETVVLNRSPGSSGILLLVRVVNIRVEIYG